MNIRIFAATKAFIDYKGKVLIVRESKKYKDGTNVGKFDVPGGRVKPGQRFDKSLHREIKEETGLSVSIGQPFYVDEWRPKVGAEKWQIIGAFFQCRTKSDKIKLSKDHNKFLWINPKDYKKFDLIDSIKRAFEAYLDRKK